MSDQPQYRNVTSTVRTPRCAILINENSNFWQSAINGTIAQASKVWGGQHFLIVPTDGVRIKDKFWEVLEAYSPDHIGVYTLTVTDLAEVQPEKYTEVKEHYRRGWEKQGFTLDFEEWFTDSAAASPVDELEISADLEAELLARLSPFHFQDRAVKERISASSGFGFPFTKIAKVIGATTSHIGQITLPKPIDDPTLSILVHSKTGLATPSYQTELTETGFSVKALPEDYKMLEFAGHAFSVEFPHLAGDDKLWHPTEDYMERTPFGVCMMHLGSFYLMDRHTPEEPIVAVIGDTVDDFCLYYCLSRLHGDVYWLPLDWLNGCSSALDKNYELYQKGEQGEPLELRHELTRGLVNRFYQKIEFGHGSNRIQLRSMSLDQAGLENVRGQMDRCSYSKGEYASHVDCTPIEEPSTNCTFRAFEVGNYANDHSLVFINNISIAPFVGPKPKSFTEIRLPHHYWLASLRIEGYEPPALPTLGTKILNMHGTTTMSRVAKDGIVYQLPNMAYFGGDVDSNMVRPKIHLLNEMDLLGEYFATIGTTIRYSDKGNYFVDTLDRLGGLQEAASSIRSPKTRSILEKFITKKNADDGSVIYLINDQRAYLNLDAFTESMGDPESAAGVADSLVGKRVIQRGHIFHCERCRLSSWYSIDGLTIEFECSRCSLRQQFTRSHWKNPVEPRWYYKLAETIYQFYLHNSHLTVQVLDALQSESRYAFHYVPEIELIDFPSAGKKKEMDVACILDGQIVFGECKTEQLSPRDVEKFEALVKVHKRRPDRIVFATTHKTVTGDFQSRVATLPNSQVMTFSQLYDS